MPCEDVGMGNDEDEGPLEAEIPRTSMNPMNPTGQEKLEHEDSGHAVHKNCVLLVSKAQELVDNIELNDCCFWLLFHDARKCGYVSGPDLSRQQVWSNGSDML